MKNVSQHRSSPYACRKPIGGRLTENRAMLISNERFVRLIVWAYVAAHRRRLDNHILTFLKDK